MQLGALILVAISVQGLVSVRVKTATIGRSGARDTQLEQDSDLVKQHLLQHDRFISHPYCRKLKDDKVTSLDQLQPQSHSTQTSLLEIFQNMSSTTGKTFGKVVDAKVDGHFKHILNIAMTGFPCMNRLVVEICLCQDKPLLIIGSQTQEIMSVTKVGGTTSLLTEDLQSSPDVRSLFANETQLEITLQELPQTRFGLHVETRMMDAERNIPMSLKAKFTEKVPMWINAEEALSIYLGCTHYGCMGQLSNGRKKIDIERTKLKEVKPTIETVTLHDASGETNSFNLVHIQDESQQLTEQLASDIIGSDLFVCD